jgi:4-diphosphocytidyl-2-C-methyl-D-erythritol kinase
MEGQSDSRTVRAYAKINLGLRIIERREDGYHNLLTVFHRIALYDEIVLRRGGEIEVESDDPALPGGESNLCSKAASALRRATGYGGGMCCTLRKKIPMGGGLGGGSTDAAAVLAELPLLWGTPVDEALLQSLALQLGSDVPYFLGNGSAVAEGRGAELTYFVLDVPYAILVCHPNIHVSTSWAYSRITPRPRPALDMRELLTAGMQDPRLLREELMNDFEDPVFAAHAAIRAVKEHMMHEGALFALMSGSGAAVFGLFSTVEEAAAAGRHFDRQGYRTFITPPHFQPGFDARTPTA